jgi:large subunit ribosomal protein L18
MNKMTSTIKHRGLRAKRTRASIKGSSARPRLSVNISNLHISAQLIDDVNHHTLAHVTTAHQKSLKGNMTEKAAWVGAEIGKKAKAAKTKKVVFDRGSKLYHGRVQALADAARKSGLEF